MKNNFIDLNRITERSVDSIDNILFIIIMGLHYKFFRLFEERGVEVINLDKPIEVYDEMDFDFNNPIKIISIRRKNITSVVEEENEDRWWETENERESRHFAKMLSYRFSYKTVDGTESEVSLKYDDRSVLIAILKHFEQEEMEKRKAIPIHFENEDIIITDPCYIIRENPYARPDFKKYGLDETVQQKRFNEHSEEEIEKYRRYINDPYFKWEKDNDDWARCEYGDDMSILGLNKYICRDTLYGDWSCTTVDTDTNESIGEFCADAGLVAVFSLKEVLAYNPKFNYHIEKPWTTTLIKNFTGDVRFEVRHSEGVYEEDSSWHRKGEKWESDDVVVIGTGNVNFIGSQSGL